MSEYKYMFMSFRDPDINRNLGVCIIESPPDVKVASQLAWDLGINPGGEIASWPMDENGFLAQDLELNRLYSRDEMLKKNFRKMSDLNKSNN